jgi:hypothetical protein
VAPPNAVASPLATAPDQNAQSTKDPTEHD